MKHKNIIVQKIRKSVRLVLFFIIILKIASVEAKLTDPIRTFPSLPLQQRETKFQEVKKAFEERTNVFLKGKHFENWKLNNSKKEIEEEFERIQEWRTHSWYDNSGEFLMSRPDFMISQELLEKGYFRRPHLIAFDYNQTDGSYNSSSIVINDQKFLAMEAPTSKTLTHFFKLLQNFQVTQLVCLTPANESGQEQSLPYWEGRLKSSAKKTQAEQQLLIPVFGTYSNTFPIAFYSINHWQDNEGIDPKALLTLIQKVQKHYNPDTGLLACHCRLGVGRTGTFIAGFTLIQEIDRQIAAGILPDNITISIEKTVMQLSLQRPYMVSQASQYVSLYRLVDVYIQQLKKK